MNKNKNGIELKAKATREETMKLIEEIPEKRMQEVIGLPEPVAKRKRKNNIPNEKTIKSIEEACAGKGRQFKSPDALFSHLNK
ncbi:MAG: hypothetical protein WCJ01_09340 [Ignavibacteria bacterium]